MIDVSKSPGKRSGTPGSLVVGIAVLLITALLARGLINRSQPGRDPVDAPDAIVVIDSEGVAGSTKLDAWAEGKNVELRRVASTADLTSAESWVKLLVDEGRDLAPCVVIARDGSVTVVPISNNLLQAVDSTWGE